MLLISIAAMVAVLATAVFGRLASPQTARHGEEARFSWSPTSMAALFAGAFAGAAGYLGSAFEEYAIFVLALAVLGPLTAAAWEQRLREAPVYRPSAARPMRDEETRDDPAPAPSLLAGWRDEQVTASGDS